jgi:hypothetical protein
MGRIFAFLARDDHLHHHHLCPFQVLDIELFQGRHKLTPIWHMTEFSLLYLIPLIFISSVHILQLTISPMLTSHSPKISHRQEHWSFLRLLLILSIYCIQKADHPLLFNTLYFFTAQTYCLSSVLSHWLLLTSNPCCFFLWFLVSKC